MRCKCCGAETLVGEKFGKLTVILEEGKDKRGEKLWRCKCDCGKEIVSLTYTLKRGNTKSCGCLVFQPRGFEYGKEYDKRVKTKIRTYSLDTGSCWEWQKSKNPCGYGQLKYRGILERAHRISWIVFKGSIPEGMSVLHTCDNPGCVNPNHLWLGTQGDNMKDMHNKGRHR